MLAIQTVKYQNMCKVSNLNFAILYYLDNLIIG